VRGGAVQKPRETLARRSVGAGGKCERGGGGGAATWEKKKGRKGGSEGNEWRESGRVK
jgi:hypothetical protein